MAENKSRLAEIYKAEKSKGGGISSTLGKRALEKMDPRQFFNQKGFMAAALPSLFKSYSATPAKSGEKIASLGGSFSSGVLETKMDALTNETRELKIHSKLAAKNSIVLPDIARDMNVMRQNIQKLVKLQGGTAAKGTDMYFKKAGEREASYESQFGKEKPKSPTQEVAKDSEKKKGIFSTILDGLSSMFSMKGLLIAGILAAVTLGIREYFTNDDFKEKINGLVADMFSTIKGFLMDHWKEVALGLALLFPKETMALISSGISILSNGITLLSKAVTTLAPLFAEGLTFAVGRLITLLSGPAGLILLLGGALFAARKLFDQNQEEYLKLAKEKKEKGSLSEKDEARLKQLETPVNRKKAQQDLKYDPTTGKAVSDEEAAKSMEQTTLDTRTSYKRIEEAAFIQLANEWEKGGKKDPLLNPNDARNVTRRTEELKAQGYVPKDMPADVKVEGSGAPSVLPNETAGGAAVGLYPTPGMQRKPGLNHGGRTTQKLVGGGVDDERLIKPDVPKPASYSNEGKTRPTPAPSSTGAYRGQRSDTAPTPMANENAGGIDPSKTTFNDLTKEQQDIFMQKQREAEGFKPGSLTYDLNNPGAMLYSPWQKKYGAELDTTGRGVGTVKGLFAKFPTLQDGVEAQRALLSGEKYGNLPLEQAINQWVTGNKFSDVDTNMGAGGEKNTGYKNKIYAALGAPPATSSGMPTTVASASQSARPTTVASASMPSLPSVPSLMPTMPNLGDMLMGATADFSDTMRMIEGLVNNVTNITNNSTQASAGGGQQSQGNLPSVYDDVFLNLFQRVT